METKATTTDKSFDDTDKYGKTKLEQLKLKLVGHSAKVISSLTSKLTNLVIVAFFSFFFFMGLCLYLGYFYLQMHTALFVLASVFLIMGFLLLVTKGEIIKRPMKYFIITSLLKEMDKPKTGANKKKEILFNN